MSCVSISKSHNDTLLVEGQQWQIVKKLPNINKVLIPFKQGFGVFTN